MILGWCVVSLAYGAITPRQDGSVGSAHPSVVDQKIQSPLFAQEFFRCKFDAFQTLHVYMQRTKVQRLLGFRFLHVVYGFGDPLKRPTGDVHARTMDGELKAGLVANTRVP